MQVTNHMDCRMNQRGINKQMVDLALEHGVFDGDKIVLRRKDCDEVAAALRQTLKLLERAKCKGGITVVVAGDCQITTYNTGSFARPASKK